MKELIRRRALRSILVLFSILIIFSFQNCGTGFKVEQVQDLASNLGASQNEPSPKLGLVVPSAQIKQGQNLDFQVSLQAQTQDVVLSYETMDGTAIKGSDYLMQKGQITIPAGSTSAKISIPTMLVDPASANKDLKLAITATMGTVMESQTGTGLVTPAYTMPKFKQISVGWYAACGITLDDQVYCFGNNIKGELGSANSLVPTLIPGLSNIAIKKIVSGDQVTCAVTAQNTLKCLGRGGYLGTGSAIDTFVPVDVPLAGTIKAISHKGGTTCVITDRDTVKCWGNDYAGQAGEPSKGDVISVPYEIPNLTGVKAVSVGYTHSCAITAQDTIKCWGSNTYGELGNDTTIGTTTPIDSTNLTNVKEVVAGDISTCALTADGIVHCWGRMPQSLNGTNNHAVISGATGITHLEGDLFVYCGITAANVKKCWGSGSYGMMPTSSDAAVQLSYLDDAKSFSLGSSSGCLIASDDSLKCWGYGIFADFLKFSSTIALDVPAMNGALSVSMDNRHGCFVTAQNAVKCWGSNSNGGLGNNTVIDSTELVDVIGINNATQVVTANGRSCALLTTGTVKCWGDSLPNNPVRKMAVDVPNITGAKSIAMNNNQACVITAQDSVRCFDDSFAIQDMAGLVNVKQISAGLWGHFCALDNAGSVKCWGVNNFGQVGVAAGAPVSDPVAVAGLANIKSIALGGYHSCAILNSGAVKCWGYNSSGQLGNGTKVSSSTPVDAIGVADAVSLSAKSEATCAINSVGATQCWGYNYALLTASTLGATLTPANFLVGEKVSQISLGGLQSLYQDKFGRWRTIGAMNSVFSGPALFLIPK